MPTTDLFVGRQREIQQFLDWLDDEQASPVLYFHDAALEEEKKGGVGKTRLLRECAARALQDSPALIIVAVDFFDVSSRDGLMIAMQVLRRLKSAFPAWDITDIEQAFQVYQAELKSQIITDAREKLLDALTSAVTSLNQIVKKSDAGLLVFMDTFEFIEENPSVAVVQPYHPFPDTLGLESVRFVLAGRNPIDWSHPNWIDRQQHVSCISLSAFDRQDAIEYLDRVTLAYDINEQPAEVLDTLYVRTAGRPILLGLVADVLNKRTISLEQLVNIRQTDFTQSLVYEVNKFEGPLSWTILFMAHIHQEFSKDLLELLMNHPDFRETTAGMNFDELVRQISALTFVRSTPGGDSFVLHDEMRRLVNTYCWNANDPDGSFRRDLSRTVIDYYAKQIEQENNPQRKQGLLTIQLYHKLYWGLEAGFESFRQLFQAAVQLHQVPFARALLREAEKFSADFNSSQKHFLVLAKSRLLRQEENAAAALILLEEYGQQVSQSDQEFTEFLIERAGTHQVLNQFDQAVADYLRYLQTPSIQADPALTARALNYLGFTYRQQGLWNEAVKCYDESLKIARQLKDESFESEILNNLGNVYRLQGKIVDALIACESALRKRRELLAAGTTSERSVGLSINTLGMIYRDDNDLVKAKKHFQEALSIFERIGYNFGISNTCTNAGYVHLLLDDVDVANSYLQRAFQVAVHRNLRSEQANSANKLGLLYHHKEMYDTAQQYFQVALDNAQRILDNYQIAENYLGLSMCASAQNRPAAEFIDRAERISRQFNYYYLLGQAEIIQGDERFRQAEYTRAFTHYGHASRFMTRYNPIKYRNTLRLVQQRLQQTPREHLPGVTDLLLNLWYEFRMDQKYPDLLKVCSDTINYLG